MALSATIPLGIFPQHYYPKMKEFEPDEVEAEGQEEVLAESEFGQHVSIFSPEYSVHICTCEMPT